MTEEEFKQIFSEARKFVCALKSTEDKEYEKLSEATKEYLKFPLELIDNSFDLTIEKLKRDSALIEKNKD